MSLLDQPGKLAALDPQSMRGLVQSFPKQLEEAWAIAGKIRLRSPSSPPQNIIVSGLGGSAIGADVVRSALGDLIKVPFLINRDYRLPSFIGPSSLVILSSYSGNTEETLSAYREARAAKARIVCITSGGRLAALATTDKIQLVRIPDGLPPRAALGYSSIALVGCLRALGLIPDIGESVRETIDLTRALVERYGTDVPEAENRAKSLAKTLHNKIIAIYGANGVLDSAALRWRNQMEENAKNLAFHHLLPEMNHNELVGWDCPGERLREVGVVFLRDREDHPQVQRRFELTMEIISPRAGAAHEIWSEGDSRLARVFSVICLGDFVSLYLAFLNRVDPTPVLAIESLKQRLSH